MKVLNINKIIIVIALAITVCNSNAQERIVKDISQLDWSLWLDEEAEYWNDELHMPPVDLSKVEVSIPGCGWENLQALGKPITLPATVEEYYWDKNGHEYGVSGNYIGVSWFSTKLFVPKSLTGKQLVLKFESARLRAEVYVNQQLVAYDLINGTPFEADITNVAKYGVENEVAVRITDPNGNFNWRDYIAYEWGDYMTPPSHGFGGITGKVFLEAREKTHISDLFIKNKPTANEIDVEIDIKGTQSGEVTIEIKEKETGEALISETLPFTGNSFKQTLKLDKAKLWSPESPNLYFLSATLHAGGKVSDQLSKRFGFRWFEIKDIKGDRQFYLNGKRIVLRSSISWGFWPVNGIYPSDEMAAKHVRIAKELGLNMLSFHRGIGQSNVLEEADEQGLLYYEEPGGYVVRHEGDSLYWVLNDFTRQWHRERLFRMIKRDRSHPSLIIYNMQNEANRDPDDWHIEDMKDAHKLDETRTITFSSHYFHFDFNDGKAPKDPSPAKLFLEPYSHDTKIQGWWDEHHAGGPGVYRDSFYNSPVDYRLYTDHAAEIIFYGEEGAIGTPARVQLIKEAIEKNGKTGWDGQHYIEQYHAYDQFLKEKGFDMAFEDVDALTESLGNVAHYYQGRTIENIRINNTIDGYVVNGWEGFKLENHSGVVDIWRNSKGDSEIMAYYNQPTYIAVKARDKVLEIGQESVIDFYIINESNIKGICNLYVELLHDGKVLSSFTEKVKVAGGNRYGQLLKKDWQIPITAAGYSEVKAVLLYKGKKVAFGNERLYAVQLSELNPFIEVIDAKGELQEICKKAKLPNVVNLPGDGTMPDGRVVLAADIPAYHTRFGAVRQPLLEWVARGNRLVLINNIDQWTKFLEEKEVIDYRGSEVIQKVWFGGNYFVKEHPMFEGLPVNTAFNWEYQSLAHYDLDRLALRIDGGNCVVGAQVDHRKELFTSVVIIPLGKGEIVLSTLDLVGAINKGGKSAVVAKKILQNYVLN